MIWNPAALRAWDRLGCDLLFRLTARPEWTGGVVVVDIDEEALGKYGQWPWPRTRLARLADRLNAAGAAAVGWDVLFLDEERKEDTSGSPRELHEALAGGRHVLGCFLDFAPPPGAEASLPEGYVGRYVLRGGARVEPVPHAPLVRYPVPSLVGKAAGVGFVNAFSGEDGVLRRVPLLAADRGQRLYPALTLEMLRVAFDAPNGVLESRGDTGRLRGIRLGSAFFPTDREGVVGVFFRSVPPPTVPVERLLAGELPNEMLEGRIVLIGSSAAGLFDRVATPVRGEIPGVEVHANVLDNLLAGDGVFPLPGGRRTTAAATALLGLLWLIPVARWRMRWAVLLVVAVFPAVTVAAWVLLTRFGMIAHPAPMISTWALLFAAVFVVRYRNEEVERRRLRSMFGRMVSESVLRYLDEHPENLSLQGVRTEATVFFSDAANFTSIAESLEPEQVAEILNRYFTRATEVVTESGGYVDKFEGDAMMAVWNVPYATPDHALRACESALRQQGVIDELRDEFRRDYGIDWHVRMGINTGPVVAGNMGSETHFEYTVLGDAVNQASRYEPLNKKYGTRIIIGEETNRRVSRVLETRFIDRVTVRGRSEPVEIYELVSPQPGGRKAEISNGNPAL
ncbi:Adenylate cyclase 2 [Kiritimatiella glycovorans]|uniref:Adenylate cyclase 2 n=2 Tax=Kiritimatiella glycovorans TaxID=1307763 RepID=A0A0G3EL54_9BACT|nr:Adenylate cyclase 2 [Kiritimatiella glycovorans]